MNETDFAQVLQFLKDKPWLALFALVAWAELRFLPLAIDAIAWDRAIAEKLGVTAADVARHRPTATATGFLWRLFRRPPSGGPPPAVVLLVAGVLAFAGCACPAADIGPKLEEAVDTYVGMSVPAPGVDPERHERAGASLRRAAEGVTRAHAE